MFTLSTGIGGERYLPNVGSMPYLDQGSANACGTTCLAMAMTYLGVPRTHEQVDSAIRRWDIFSSPRDLIHYARTGGLKAEGYNRGTWQDVKAHIDQGHPCICVIEADYTYPPPQSGTLNGLHYVVISGYGRNPKTDAEFAVFHDPNVGNDAETGTGGYDMEAYLSDFRGLWDGVGWGFHNYYLALAGPRSELPPGNDDGIQGQLGALEGVANIANGLDRMWTIAPRGIVRGLLEFAGGVVQVVVCGVGALLQLGGQWLKNVVHDVPVVRNIVQPIGDILNGIGAVLADLGNAVGNVLDDAGQFVSDLFSGNVGGAATDVGNAISDAASGIANAVSDAASAVGNAVSDFFSGW